MATHDYVIDNSTGANVRADLNLVLQAILSNNSSSSAPSTTAAYMWWADTTNGILKIRNSANNAWVELLQLDGTLTLEDGSASTPALAFRDDLNTGIFSSAADTFNVATGGVERMELGATTIFNEDGANVDFRIEGDNNANLFYLDAGNDRVGIGTSSPQHDLDILKTGSGDDTSFRVGSTATSGDNDATIVINNGGSGDASLRFDYESSASRCKIYTNSSTNDLIFDTDGNETMRLKADHKVGIGTTSPTGVLEIDAASTTDMIMLDVGGTNFAKIGHNFASGVSVLDIRSEGHYRILTGGNNERMRIDSSGNVMIGTTSPDKRLTLVDRTDPIALIIGENDNATTDAGLRIQARNTANSSGFSLDIAVDADASAATFDFGGSERMRIDSSGRLLVGTTTASHFTDRLLTVASSGGAGIEMRAGTSSISQLSFSDGSGNDNSGYRGFISYAHSTDTMNFGTSATNRIVVNSSGKVGIGEVSPASQLHLKGSDTVLGGVGNSTTACGAKITLSDSAGRQAAFYAPSTTDAGIGTITNHVLTFIVSNTEKARMMSTNQSDPAFLIGTSTNSLGTSAFGIAAFYDGSLVCSRNVTGSNSVVYFGGTQGNANVKGDGDLENTNNSYGQISDETLKQDIVDAGSQWDDIKALRVRKFRFKANPTGVLQIGVVAQEVETVSAGLVSASNTDIKTGAGETVKSVKYSVLYMKAVKCLQEAMAKIEVLETKVAALEAA